MLTLEKKTFTQSGGLSSYVNVKHKASLKTHGGGYPQIYMNVKASILLEVVKH